MVSPLIHAFSGVTHLALLISVIPFRALNFEVESIAIVNPLVRGKLWPSFITLTVGPWSLTSGMSCETELIPWIGIMQINLGG
jgi:hypothetical protein